MLPSNKYGVLDEQVEALAAVAVGDDEGLGGHKKRAGQLHRFAMTGENGLIIAQHQVLRERLGETV